ncbi:MAG: hypothetical protein AB7E98_11980 [Pirellulales bacterium]
MRLPGAVIQFTSDPRVAPQLRGASGQLGYYGGTPYFFDRVWKPLRGRRGITLPYDAGLVWAFNGDDIDANGTQGAAYADGEILATWKHFGLSTINATQSSGYQKPSFSKYGIGGRGTVYFDGRYQRLQLASSTAAWKSIYATTGTGGGGTIFFVGSLMATVAPAQYRYLLYQVASGTDRGISVQVLDTDRLNFQIAGGGASVALNWSPTFVLTRNQAFFGYFRHNGTTAYCSVNGAAEESQAITTGNLDSGAASATRDLYIGSTDSTHTNSWNGELAYLLMSSTNYGPAMLAQVTNELRESFNL